MGKATSLVELILKKWGDDIAGAAKELEEMVGFPESVANRIATGELPMDAESVARRSDEQGYGPVLYHGSTNPDMTEIAPMEVGKRNATGGNGLFLTDNPRVASTYAYDARVNGGKGPEGATIYPLRVRDTGRDDWVTVKDRGHKGEEYSTFWDEIPAENIRGMDTDMYEAGQYLETDQINRTANRQGKKLVEYTNLYDSGEDVYSVGGTEVPSNVTAVLDNTLVRSPNAAFDPEYTGPNIMGGAALPVAAGLLAAGQSDDADASVTLRLLKEAPEAYNALRKQLARDRQKGLSPMRTAEKFIHDQSMTNYDKGFNQYARKVDGTSSGDYWKEGVQGLYDEIMGAVDEPDPMVVEAMDAWLGSHLGRETGSTMAQNRAGARAARAAAGGVAATAAAGASADEGLPLPTWEDVGDSLFTVLGMPMAGLQGLARGAYGLMTGEDLVTAAAEANHMTGGSLDGNIGRPGGDTEEGWDRVGGKVEGLFEPLDKQFPYLGLGRAAGDTTSLGLSLFSPF